MPSDGRHSVAVLIMEMRDVESFHRAQYRFSRIFSLLHCNLGNHGRRSAIMLDKSHISHDIDIRSAWNGEIRPDPGRSGGLP